MDSKPQIESLSADERPFEITSGAMRVTDPCYSVDTWCSGKLEQVKNGKWLAKVGYYKDPDEQVWADERRAELKKNVDEATGVNIIMKSYHQVKLDDFDKSAKSYKGRESILLVRHESYPEFKFGELDFSSFIDSEIEVGVDSGQAGFFDLAKYTEHVGLKDAESPLKDAFYRGVMKLTLGEGYRPNGHPGWGSMEFGCVSFTGYGDGGYKCYALRDEAGDVVAAVIVYIEEYDEKEDEE